MTAARGGGAPSMINRLLVSLAVLIAICAGTSLDVARAQTTQAPTIPGSGKKQEPPMPDLRGEWRRAGDGFACELVSRKRLDPQSIQPEIMVRACLRMGPLVVGADATTLAPLLGTPARTVPQPKGATASVYFLEGAGRHPYLVVTVLEGRIVALQLTGPAAAKDYSFNHIDLGASSETLIKYFGPARHLQPDSQKGMDLWSYLPWTFSFEIKDDRVFSIRIADPEY